MHRIYIAKETLYFSPLLDLPGIVHGFGTAGFSLEAYLKALKLDHFQYPLTLQSHSTDTWILDQNISDQILEGDAFITATPAVVPFIKTADCVPILLADASIRAVGAIHAGWRGVARGVVKAAISKMQEKFGCQPQALVAAIGPSICKNCFPVGADVVEEFEKHGLGTVWFEKRDEKFVLDPRMVVQFQLQQIGLKPENIDLSDQCTRCNPEFYSCRRDHQEKKRQVSFIALNW